MCTVWKMLPKSLFVASSWFLFYLLNVVNLKFLLFTLKILGMAVVITRPGYQKSYIRHCIYLRMNVENFKYQI